MRLAVHVPGAPIDAEVLVVPSGLTGPTAADLEALRAFAGAGGKLLGLADGVAWLCAAGLLPGALTSVVAHARATHVRVEGRATPFTWAIPAGRILALGGEGAGARYAVPEDVSRSLAARGQVVLRYCDTSGGVGARQRGDEAATIAGVCDDSGRVVGLLAPVSAGFDDDLGRQLRRCLEPA